MSGKETRLTIVVDAQNKANAALESVNSSLSTMGTSLEASTARMKTIGTYGAVAFAGVAAAIYSSVDAAAAAAKIDAQLDAVLRSTAGAAGLSRDELEKQSKALEKLTTYDDEAVRSAQALLLTFTAVKGPIFKDSINVILDMSTALGQDLKSSAIQLGKALQDPINGITALRRVGVNFTDDQQAVITKLTETGHQAEAQRLILAELNKEFGGSAQAQAQTYAGQLEQLKNRFHDLQESIGAAFIPALTRLLNAVAPIVESMIAWTDAHPKLTEAILGITLIVAGLFAVLLPIALVLPGLITLFGGLAAAFLVVTAISAPLLLAIGGIVTILGVLAANGYTTQTAWQNVWLGIKVITAEAANAVISTIESMINFVLSGVNKAIAAINKVISAAQKVPGIGKLVSTIKPLGNVSLGSVDTGTIASDDLSSRSTSSITPSNIIQMAGNVFLSTDVAAMIGDAIIGKLKLSNAL